MSQTMPEHLRRCANCGEALIDHRRAEVQTCDDFAPRCGGSGLLYEPVSHPSVDHRDPRYVDREFECPGCPDCAVRCGWVSPSGNVCIKRPGHTGVHAVRKPAEDFGAPNG